MGLYRNFTISFSIVTLMRDSFLTMYKWTEIKLRKSIVDGGMINADY